MLNFDLYNPTKYVFGKDQTQQLKTLIPTGSKVLIAYGGGSIFKNGIYDSVKANLEEFECLEFGGIEPNPQMETLVKAIEIIKKENITFILAVGGGSIIDGVKFISAATHFKEDPAEILQKRILFKDSSKTIPFGTVLTLPATGSEMNSGAVVTIAATQEKLTLGGSALFPQFSICDPTVIESLPKRQLQNGVVDAFFHVMEQYLTFPQDALLQDRIAESILQTLIEIGPDVVDKPTDYKLASNFMWCCTMALNGLIQKGVLSDWATHMIGHELTALHNIDHARTLSIIGPNLYRTLFDTKKEKLAQYAGRVWNITEGSIEQKAELGLNKTISFLKQMGMPLTVAECTSDYNETTNTIVNRFTERGWTVMGEKKNITPEVVRQIVDASLK